METENTIRDEQGEIMLWCLRHPKTLKAAQLPRAGLLLCFESAQAAELFRTKVLNGGSSLKISRFLNSDLPSHVTLTVWDQEKGNGYLVAD